MGKWSPSAKRLHLVAKQTIGELSELKVRSLDLLFLFYQENHVVLLKTKDNIEATEKKKEPIGGDEPKKRQ